MALHQSTWHYPYYIINTDVKVGERLKALGSNDDVQTGENLGCNFRVSLKYMHSSSLKEIEREREREREKKNDF